MKSSSLSVDESIIEPIEDVSAVGTEENKTCSPKRCGVRFDPPLNLNSYVSVVSFPNKLAVAKEVARENEVKYVQPLEDKARTANGKKVWVKVPTEGKKK